MNKPWHREKSYEEKLCDNIDQQLDSARGNWQHYQGPEPSSLYIDYTSYDRLRQFDAVNSLWDTDDDAQLLFMGLKVYVVNAPNGNDTSHVRVV